MRISKRLAQPRPLHHVVVSSPAAQGRRKSHASTVKVARSDVVRLRLS